MDIRTCNSYLFIYSLIFQSSCTDFFFKLSFRHQQSSPSWLGLLSYVSFNSHNRHMCLSTPTTGNSLSGYQQQQKAAGAVLCKKGDLFLKTKKFQNNTRILQNKKAFIQISSTPLEQCDCNNRG